MNKKSIENKVNKSFSSVTPQVYNSIANDVAGINVDRSKQRRRAPKNLFWKLASGLLSLVLVVLAISGIAGNVSQTAQASTVSLDVNPSVSIALNRNNRVIKVEALNEDGKVLIADMDFNGCQLKVAVNALIGSMLRAGYLSDMANSVLVSVDSNKNNYQAIAELVANEITVTLKQGQIDASVVSQWIKSDDAIAKIAKEHKISLGKAQLISKIVAKTDYTVEQLVELSVNELSLLLPNVGIDDNDIEQSGSASAKEYIDKTVAFDKALAAAKIEGLTSESSGLKESKIKLDFDDGEMVYDTEFVYENYEYEVEVGAISGEIVAFKKSLADRYVANTEEAAKISSGDDAKKYALEIAGVEEDAVDNKIFVEQMWYFRGTVYEVFFQTAEMCYQYCIGSDGTVIEEYYEMLNLSVADSYLKRGDVINWFIANNTDGFTKLDNNSRMRVYSEKTVDGRLVYELSFVSNGNMYVYRIDAVNKVIESREVTEFNGSNSGNNGWQGGFGQGGHFGHGGSDWYWGDWDWDDFDDDFDDFDDFDDDDYHHFGGFEREHR